MRKLVAVLLLTLVAFSFPSQHSSAAEPRLLAQDAVAAVLLHGGQQVLYYNSSREYSLIDIESGRSTVWEPGWKPEDAGMRHMGNGSVFPQIAASPDGGMVAIASFVEFDGSDPAQEWPHMAHALVLCAADGGTGRLAALVESTDGGPHLDFSADGRYLITPWFINCAPSVSGYEAWFNEVAQGNYSAEEQLGYPNALDVRNGQLVHLENVAESEWGIDKSPYSDWYFFEDIETPTRFFGNISGNSGGTLARWSPREDEFYFRTQWVSPEHLLAWSDAGQSAVHRSGQSWALAGYSWEHYCQLPDGRSFFSRDGGRTIELGTVDWHSGSVNAAQPRPDLAQFAHVLEGSWPVRVDTWLPLPDSRGAIVSTPGMDIGRIFHVIADL